MKYAIALVALTFAACSGESAKNANNGWEVGENNASNNGSANNGDANNGDANNGDENNGAANNGANNGTPANNGIMPENNGMTPGNNGTSDSNNATTGMTTGDSNNTPGPGMGVEGDDCGLNSDCGSGLTCCPGLDGSVTCQADCVVGGLCGGMDSECPADEECCDFSSFNQPDTCLRNCPGDGGGGPMGAACMVNSDCAADELCCPGLGGNATCSTECFGGGLCETDTDCRNGQLCCDFQVAKACLDQCNF